MSKSTSAPPHPPVQVSPPQHDSRRSFLTKLAAGVLGGIAAAVPLAAGIVTFFDPLRPRGGKAPKTRVASLAALPTDGTPRLFPVVATRRDAWTQYPHEPIGAVYVRRVGERVEAFNASCPHLGCFVDFRQGQFLCPCHNSSFAVDGQRIIPPPSSPPCPSPRDLDPLEVDPQKLAQGEVWVVFQNFRKGTAERIPEV